jgi:hypothetical protein
VYVLRMAVGPELFSGLVSVPIAVRGAQMPDGHKALSDKELEPFRLHVAPRTHDARRRLPPWDLARCPPEGGFRA